MKLEAGQVKWFVEYNNNLIYFIGLLEGFQHWNYLTKAIDFILLECPQKSHGKYYPVSQYYSRKISFITTFTIM
jgi:hypothetical protein